MSSTDHAQKANDATIETTKQALEANGFTVIVVDTVDQARDAVLTLIPEGSEVFTATSVTVDKTGLRETFNESGKYESVRHKIAELAEQNASGVEKRRMGSAAEYSIGSVQALTEDGQAVLASATGSQLPGYVYGADHVVWLVGSQKIVKDVNEAMERINIHVFPLEDARSQVAYGSGSHLSKVLIYRREASQRVTIVLIKDAVGY